MPSPQSARDDHGIRPVRLDDLGVLAAPTTTYTSLTPPSRSAATDRSSQVEPSSVARRSALGPPSRLPSPAASSRPTTEPVVTRPRASMSRIARSTLPWASAAARLRTSRGRAACRAAAGSRTRPPCPRGNIAGPVVVAADADMVEPGDLADVLDVVGDVVDGARGGGVGLARSA